MPTASRAHRETRRRRAAVQLVAVGVGLAYGYLLLYGLKSTYVSRLPPAPVRVAFVETPPPREVVIEPPPVLPQLPIEAPPIAAREMNEALPAPTPPPSVELEELQVESAVVTVAAPEGLDPEEDIYAPLRGRVYDEQPGGDVLVLAVLIDRHGHVYNAQIMVPSGNPVGDLTRLLALPGSTLTEIPQIPVGEKRWIDIRFRYPSLSVALP